jgi:hypothetical protein
MKKLVLFLMCFMIGYLISIETYAGTNYTAFESITLTEGKLLENFTKDDYTDFYKKVDKRKFSGWQIHKVSSNVKVSYISETLFSYYNDGFTAISYDYRLDRKVSTKLGLSATGSIGMKGGSEKKVFKNNLEGSLKLSSDYLISTEDKETFDISLKVDPGTQVDLYTYGEGKLTNGVGAYYYFWIRTQRGGFEVFVVTTEYQRLEKKRI